MERFYVNKEASFDNQLNDKHDDDNCNWVDTWWQQYSTHLHTNSTHNNTMKHST